MTISRRAARSAPRSPTDPGAGLRLLALVGLLATAGTSSADPPAPSPAPPAGQAEGGDGSYVVHSLAPGSWTVQAKARGENAWLHGTAEVEAGSAVEITLAPK